MRGTDVFVDLRRVNVDLNDLRALAEFIHVARHAVVEPAAEREKEFAF